MRILSILSVVCCLVLGCQKNQEQPQQPAAGPSQAPPKQIGGMVWIPAGKFMMGSYTGMKNETPVHEVEIDGFYLDKTEVTNAQYRRFVEATGYLTTAERELSQSEIDKMPPDQQPKGPVKYGSILFQMTEGPVPLNRPVWWKLDFEANWRQPLGAGSDLEGKENHPVVCVTYDDAKAYADWAGKRLPTEAEWEYAARGGLTGKKYEWGNAPLPAEKDSSPADWRCNIWQGKFPYLDYGTDGYKGTAPVGCYRPNGYGLHDMTGNVWEICADLFGANYYNSSPKINPKGPASSQGSQTGMVAHVMRGASWRIHRTYGPVPPGGSRPILEFRVATRNEAAIDTATNDVGFRCAKDR